MRSPAPGSAPDSRQNEAPHRPSRWGASRRWRQSTSRRSNTCSVARPAARPGRPSWRGRPGSSARRSGSRTPRRRSRPVGCGRSVTPPASRRGRRPPGTTSSGSRSCHCWSYRRCSRRSTVPVAPKPDAGAEERQPRAVPSSSIAWPAAVACRRCRRRRRPGERRAERGDGAAGRPRRRRASPRRSCCRRRRSCPAPGPTRWSHRRCRTPRPGRQRLPGPDARCDRDPGRRRRRGTTRSR